MLYQFLLNERDGILALCREKLSELSEPRGSSEEMELGLPVFYEELIEVLRLDENDSPDKVDRISGMTHHEAASRRGKEAFRLGYTASQVVHGYGAHCQAITQYAAQHSEEPIGAREFNRLNFCLDVAIAEAVTEYNRGQRDATARDEVQRLGFLAHEMRNALATVSMAHQSIKMGLVGLGGSTNKMLEDAVLLMKDLIDRSLAEVRLRGEPVVERERVRVIDMVSEVEATAQVEARAKSIKLSIDVGPQLMVFADHHLVTSAISNVVQNAIKFTKQNGHVWVRGREAANRVLITIEDECGGLPPGKIEELFKPFSQKGIDRSGVGLGLAISRRAIELNDGEISARDIPGKGCEFTIELPKC
jgi:signal transduction histidine kinase